jgi:hypothetical protein
VAEQFFDGHDVRAVFEQMRRKRVAHHVRRDVLHEPGELRELPEDDPRLPVRETLLALREEQRFVGAARTNAQVVAHRIGGGDVDEHVTLLIAFADHAHDAPVEIDIA